MCRVFWPAVLLLSVTTAASAESAGDNSGLEPMDIETVVVIASKRPRPLSDVVGQVSVIDAEFIARYLVENIDELLGYEPGLNIESSGTRFSGNAINVRGIGGNRVAIEIDGIPSRDRFAIGSYSDGGRLLSETDRIKRVEVLYGPASTLYGSDAIGGVIAITTWDPDDLLALGDGKSRFSLRGGYQSANSSLVGSGLAAWGDNNNGILFAGTWRDGHEPDSQAQAGAPQDAQNWNSQDYFVRYTHDTKSGNRLRFTFNKYLREVQSDTKSLPGFGRFRNTTSLLGDGKDENQQLAFDYEFSSGKTDGVLRVYDVESSTRQVTHEERAKGSRPDFLERVFEYDQDFRGIELNLFRDISTQRALHHLGAGIDFRRTESSELRDGYQQSLIDGSITNTILGENMPLRDFPNSQTDEIGIFVQDEISLADGRWEVIPALRYDHYSLDPSPDAIYLEDNPETEVVSIREGNFSPRFGVLYHLNEKLGIYAQYSNGFRAPPFEDANIGLDVPLLNTRAIPNPDLKSETSNGIEVGFRYLSQGTRLTLAMFDTDYKDFIETKAFIGIDPKTGTFLFQSRNIDTARIYGLDLKLEQNLAAWTEKLENWSLNAAAFWSKGDNKENGQPLNSISPPQMVLGVSWFSPGGSYNANLVTTITAAQNRIDETAAPHFHTPSWATLDLTANWRINENLDLRLGAFNLTDETYWRWSDVSTLTPDNPMIALLSRPGRNYALSARFQW